MREPRRKRTTLRSHERPDVVRDRDEEGSGASVVGATKTPVEKAERTVAGISPGNGAGIPVASLRGHDEKNLHGHESTS
ncbi:hypothetical protein FrEUN1fDRAFT_5571 [Parafrankia sp. EUN1f]|nr:hypothetical protein FrEUN1fDRAFT_5571 [Parafrankia sp. EUN1f]